MRKIINIFICIVSILSFIVSFKSFDVDESNRVANIENEIGEAFYIPDDITLSNPEEVSVFFTREYIKRIKCKYF